MRNLTGQALLITDPPPTSSTVLQKKKKHEKCVIRHVTHDMGHIVGGEHSLQNSAFQRLWLGKDSILTIGRKRMIQLMNDKSVCKTALATPAPKIILLKSLPMTQSCNSPLTASGIFAIAVQWGMGMAGLLEFPSHLCSWVTLGQKKALFMDS